MGRLGRLLELVPRGSVGAVLSRAANAALAFGSTVVIARALGAGAYGSYSLAVTVLGLLALVTQAGLDSMTARNLAVFLHGGDLPRAFAFLRWTTRVVLAASAVVYAVGFAVLTLNPIGWTPDQVAATKLILVGLPFVSLLRLARGRLQALDKTALGLAVELPFWNALLLASGLAAALVPGLRTSVAMAALHVGTFAVAWGVAAYLVWRNLPARPDADAKPEAAPAKPGWLRSAALFTVLAGLNFVLSQGGVLWAGTLLTEEETGHFSVALRTASIVLLVLTPIQQVIAPRIAKAWSANDVAATERIARRCGEVSLAAAALLAAAFWLAGPWLLLAFGEEYGDALWALRWLSLAQVLLIGLGPWNIVLQMIHKEGWSVAVLGVAFAVGIPLTLLLTAMYGITGTALGRVATAFLAAAGGYFAVRRVGLRILPFTRGRTHG